MAKQKQALLDVNLDQYCSSDPNPKTNQIQMTGFAAKVTDFLQRIKYGNSILSTLFSHLQNSVLTLELKSLFFKPGSGAKTGSHF